MIIIGSVREGRRADMVANWALSQLKNNSDLEIDFADLSKIRLPFFNEPVIPSRAKGQYKNAVGKAWAERVAKADAFIMLTAEYNHGPTAVLKNAIDWVYEGWMDKPVGFISYGGLAGGTRAVQQLKQNVLNVKLFPTSSNIHIPFVSQAFDETGQPKHEGMSDSLDKLVAEIKELNRKLKS